MGKAPLQCMKHSPIESLCKRNNLGKFDICRLLGISLPTLNSYIKNPGQIRLKDLHLIAGFVGINVLELVYLLDRTKPAIKKKDKWYMEGLKLDSDSREDNV